MLSCDLKESKRGHWRCRLMTAGHRFPTEEEQAHVCHLSVHVPATGVCVCVCLGLGLKESEQCGSVFLPPPRLLSLSGAWRPRCLNRLHMQAKQLHPLHELIRDASGRQVFVI